MSHSAINSHNLRLPSSTADFLRKDFRWIILCFNTSRSPSLGFITTTSASVYSLPHWNSQGYPYSWVLPVIGNLALFPYCFMMVIYYSLHYRDTCVQILSSYYWIQRPNFTNTFIELSLNYEWYRYIFQTRVKWLQYLVAFRWRHLLYSSFCEDASTFPQTYESTIGHLTYLRWTFRTQIRNCTPTNKGEAKGNF